jgi:hypothetical protein
MVDRTKPNVVTTMEAKPKEFDRTMQGGNSLRPGTAQVGVSGQAAADVVKQSIQKARITVKYEQTLIWDMEGKVFPSQSQLLWTLLKTIQVSCRAKLDTAADLTKYDNACDDYWDLTQGSLPPGIKTAQIEAALRMYAGYGMDSFLEQSVRDLMNQISSTTKQARQHREKLAVAQSELARFEANQTSKVEVREKALIHRTVCPYVL